MRRCLSCCVRLVMGAGLCTILAACAERPDFGVLQQTQTGPAPTILPIDALIAQAGPIRPEDSASAELNARAAELRARAKALQGPVGQGNGT
jgi:hypothetical protein